MSAPEMAYLSSVEWRCAKTMPEWPHESTVKAWRPELSANFERFCRLIQHCGAVEPWPVPPAKPIYHNSYLVIDRHMY